MPRFSSKYIDDWFRTYRYLCVSDYLARRDVSIRFLNTRLGIFWPMVTTLIWALSVSSVYASVFSQNLGTFLPKLIVGFTIWGILTQSVTESFSSFYNAEGYIKQFPLPIQVYSIRTFLYFVYSNSPQMFLALVSSLWYSADLNAIKVSALLLAILILLLMLLLHSIAFSYLGTVYRDAPYLTGATMQVLFLITPIIFPSSALDGKGLSWLYLYNPYYSILSLIYFSADIDHSQFPIESVMCAIVYISMLAVFCFILPSRLHRNIAIKL